MSLQLHWNKICPPAEHTFSAVSRNRKYSEHSPNWGAAENDKLNKISVRNTYTESHAIPKRCLGQKDTE
jgi:hypothetical protein